MFALGYLMRPVGGVVIGHIGDRFGRRAALTFSVAAMAIPTFLIGLLPGDATLGLLAPIALTFLRMVQGLGGRRIYQLDGVPGRARAGRPSRLDGRAGVVRGLWSSSRSSSSCFAASTPVKLRRRDDGPRNPGASKMTCISLATDFELA